MICRTCEVTKDEREFPWHRKGVRRHVHCRLCLQLIAVARKWGFDSTAEYLEYVQRPCDICGTTAARRVLDHEHGHHATRHRACRECWRGALCDPCNRALGMVGDSLAGIARFVRYLEGAA